MSKLIRRLSIFRNYQPLLSQLVTKDIKLKYRRSFLGYFWSILNPLLIMIIMVIVFSNMFRFDIKNYPVYLIIGLTIFGFVNESTNQAMFSIVGNAPLLKKTYVPKYIFFRSNVNCIYCLQNTIYSLYDVYSDCIISSIYFLYWIRTILSSGDGVFSRYSIYLCCVYDSVDVFDTYFLSNGATAGGPANYD